MSEEKNDSAEMRGSLDYQRSSESNPQASILEFSASNYSNEDSSKIINEKKRRKTKNKKVMKAFKKNKHIRATMAGLAAKEKDQMSKEVRSIFKSESLMSNNIKSLQKEKKINDTIVAIISFIMIILCFYQLYLLIDAEYQQTDRILTFRTCIVILSIPNCKKLLIYEYMKIYPKKFT
jgi:hypothetical protein